jgi:hypothetical protein
MSLPFLMNLIDEACKSGSITIDDKLFLFKKANEFSLSTDLVEKILIAKNINIIDNEDSTITKESVLNNINAPIRDLFVKYFHDGSYDTIITYFDDKLFATIDYVLIDTYLKALLRNKEYNKAFKRSEVLISNIDSEINKIYPTLGQIYLYTSHFKKAFDIYFVLILENQSKYQSDLDLLVEKVLDNGNFELLNLCKKNKNYKSIASSKLNEFYSANKYSWYLRLFEEDFSDDENFVYYYIWSLFKNDGTEVKAYEKGLNYMTKIQKPESLFLVMGHICKYLEKWGEAYEYYKKCMLVGTDSQSYIDNIIDILIDRKKWIELKKFSDSTNYNNKINEVFTAFDDNDDYENIVNFFDDIGLNIYEKYKIKRYTNALFYVSPSRAYNNYKEYDSYFSKDKSWFWIGGMIFEYFQEYPKAFSLYQNANSLEPGYCSDDVLRINLIINPHIHFTNLFNENKYIEAIEFFESKLSKTTDIDLILNYIISLYKNDGTEEKALELAIPYSKSNREGYKLFRIIAVIYKYLNKHYKAQEYFTKAESAGFDVKAELQEVNMIIAKNEEAEKKRIESEKIEAERMEVEEKKRILEMKAEIKRIATLKKLREEAEREPHTTGNSQNEDTNIIYDEYSEDNSSVNQESDLSLEHEFSNDWKRGGNILLQEYIYIRNGEVTWEKKKTLLFGKDSISIPIDKVSLIELETSLIGTDIIIRSKGFGFIKGTNFKKNDAKRIEKLILKAQKK